MSQSCPRRRQVIAALAATNAALPEELAEHLHHCAGCAALAAELAHGLRLAAAKEPPAVADAVREAQISDALRTRSDAPTRPEWGVWGLRVGMAVPALAVLVLVSWGVVSQLRSTRLAAGPALLAGQAQAGGALLQVGDLVVSGVVLETDATQSAQIGLSDHSKLVAAPMTRFLLAHGGASRVRLEVGALTLAVTQQPANAPFVIDTDEAVVQVVGTQFSVERDHSAALSRTVVRVREGRVRVVSRVDGAESLVAAGEALTIERRKAEVAPAEPQARADDVAVGAERPQRVSSPTLIRSRINDGQLEEAQQLLKRARAASGMTRSERAELAVVEAELALAERHLELGIERYLAVVEAYPKTPQAEEALFAAAQLSVEQQQDPERALRLLNRYCQSYPEGRFADQAQRLRAALQKVAK